MFFSTETMLSRINGELRRSGSPVICRSTFYEIRKIYTRLYPSPRSSKHAIYDERVLLFFYFCAKAHGYFQRYALLWLYMERIDQQLTQRNTAFCDAFPSFDAINAHFLKEVRVVA